MDIISTFSISTPVTKRPALVDIQKEIEALQVAHGVPFKEREISNLAIANLLKWKALPVSVAAATISPLILRDPYPHDDIERMYSREAITLAEQLIKWHQDCGIGREIAINADVQQLSALLRHLYRQSYLNLPDFSFILLLLADHDARLHLDDSTSPNIAQLTKEVFIPFAEMLGCWYLYRRWVEKSYSQLYSEDFSDIKRLMGEPKEYSQQAFEALLRKKRTLDKSDDLSAQDRQWLSDKKFLFDKAEAFLHLKTNLLKVLNSKKLQVDIVPIGNHTGPALRRIQKGESKIDVLTRLSVRILCRSIDECYAVLGIVHSLGKPVSYTSNIHFEDHIASPRPNGYQALHAAIVYRDFKKSEENIIIEFRILTKKMHKLNENGPIASLRQKKKMPLQVQAWWDSLPTLTADLHRRFGSARWTSVEHLLTEQELSSRSDPIYVFTPRGEIVLLKRGSTPLDFAYHIHTDMGDHAMSVEVNGQAVPHNYPLSNGDMVLIHYDPHFIGPDLSWLLFVATPFAQASIRRGLTRLASSNNRGRVLLQDDLLKILRYYEREKGYNISITTSQLDDFLMRRFKYYGCESIEDLYSRVEDKSIPSDQIMWRLISDELSLGAQGVNGTALQYHPHLVTLCSFCRPAPGEAIVGCENPVSRSTKKLVIHRQGDYKCINQANPERLVPLSWAEGPKGDEDKFLVFQISAEDRLGLLREVLEIVYRTRKAYLFSVDAQTSNDGHAKISLVIKADSFRQLADIKSQFVKIARVTSISSFPPSPSQQLAWVRTAQTQLQPLYNPYTTEEVYTRGSFYDREEPLDSLLKWLDEPLPASALILHGQRRVGKTSLVKYLINEFLAQRRSLLPVYITFQDLDLSNTNTIVFGIAKFICYALQQPVPEPAADGTRLLLNDVLREALKHYPRLLVVFDELDALMEAQDKPDPQIYNKLRAIMSGHRSINWILVIQDKYFFDPSFSYGISQITQKVGRIQLKHLDSKWARKLIVEPTKKCGITLQDEKKLTGKMLELTAGSPYFINLICYELVNRMLNLGRTNITDQDLEHVINLVTYEGRIYFDHFLKNLNPIKRVILAAIAEVCTTTGYRDASEIVGLIERESSYLRPPMIHKNLQEMTNEGLVELITDELGIPQKVSIPIGIFRSFISKHLTMLEAIEDLNAARFLSKKNTEGK